MNAVQKRLTGLLRFDERRLVASCYHLPADVNIRGVDPSRSDKPGDNGEALIVELPICCSRAR